MEKPSLKCRVCLETKSKDALASVTKSWCSESSKSIKDAILFCVPTVSIQDNSYLCSTCLWHLKFAYQFIECCLKTEEILVQRTTRIIKNLPLNGNKIDKLENILGKGIEDGSKIQIIFENPIQGSEGNALEQHDHTYFVSSSDKDIKNFATDEENLVKPEYVQTDNMVGQEEEIQVKLDSDDWFEEKVMDFEENLQTDEGEPDVEPSSNSDVMKVDDEKYPQELLDLLDFYPVNVRCVTIEKELTPEHEAGLLQEGINIVNISTNPDKKKRIIYLARDLVQSLNRCHKCQMFFHTRCDYLDHKHLHKKGKISLPGVPEFSCNLCFKTFMFDLDLRKHYSNAHGFDHPYQCPKCPKKFKTYKDFRNHQENFESSGMCEVKCKKCDKVFIYKTQLDNHEADVADAPCCDYRKCKVCLVKFTKEDFKKHCKIHPNYLCPECGKSFHSNSSLTTHRKSVHTAISGMCHECGKVIKNAKVLQHHIDAIHGQNSYMCDKCPRQFRSKIYLRKHALMVHSEKQRNFTCEKCGKAFHTKYALNQHIKLLHLVPAKFICPTCGEGFVRNDYLKRHIAHHEKYIKYSCSICKMSFSTESRLLSHQEVGHDENGKPLDHGRKILKHTMRSKKDCTSSKPCICNICHKVLIGTATLKIHYKSHLKIRDFSCEKCEITLQTNTAYRNHMKKHENPNFEFSCNICHVYKSSRVELENHIAEVHKNMKYKCKYCPAKFGRKHLLYSHESIKHKEEYAKKQNLFKLLAGQKATLAPETSVRKTNKGVKRGLIDVDVDQVIGTLANSSEEPSVQVKSEDEQEKDPITAENFDILSEDYQITEEETPCKVLVEDVTNVMNS